MILDDTVMMYDMCDAMKIKEEVSISGFCFKWK